MRLAEQHEQLLKALESDKCNAFAELTRAHLLHKDQSFDEMVEALPTAAWDRLCTALNHQVDMGLAKYHSQNASSAEDASPPQPVLHGGSPDQQKSPMEQDTPAAVEHTRETVETSLRGTALMARVLLEALDSKAPPPGLLQAAAALHDNALLMAPDSPVLQDAVAQLCCAVWSAKVEGRECVVAQTLPFLVIRALTTEARSDVKRCNAIRDALELLDWDNAAISDTKRYLLRAAFSPAFLRVPEGRRFVAFLFTLQPQMVRELTAIIRNQIPAGRKSILDAYGEIAFQAWRHTFSGCRYEVDHTLLQGLMQAAVLASTPAMGAAIRRVLGGLHSQKQAPGVDALLLRLYEPIIFRALAAANPSVRRNALQLLVDAFPLHDPDANQEATGDLLTRQFTALSAALGDDVPAVRIAAVAGVCAVLDAYWELIPAATTAAFVQRLATELAFDASHAGVRAAVVEGLAGLVPNPLAQPLLAALLPQLRPLMCDAAASVRTAMADLLLVLRSVKVLQFYEVVPVPTLLEVLAADAPAVAQRVQRLVLPFYFSGPEEGPARVAQLLRSNPAAGQAFCAFLVGRLAPAIAGRPLASRGSGVPADQIVQMVGALREHLMTAAPAATATAAAGGPNPSTARRKRRNAKDAAAADAAEADEPAQESQEAWEAMVAGVAELCRGLAAEAAGGSLEPEELMGTFPKDTLAKLLAACSSTAALRSVLSIAGALHFLPAAAAVRDQCMKQLLGFQALPHTNADEVSAMLACVCADAAAQSRLLRALAGGLAISCTDLEGVAEVDGSENSDIPPDRAIWFIGLMLSDASMRGALLASGLLLALLPALEAAAANDVTASVAALQMLADVQVLASSNVRSQALLVCARAAVHADLAATAACSSHEGTEGHDIGDGVQPYQLRQAVRSALAEATSCGARLVAALQECPAAKVVAALSAAPVAPPPAKKGRKGATDAASAAAEPSPIRATHAAVGGLAAMLGDAAKLVAWGGAEEVAAAACDFGAAVLRFAEHLADAESDGASTAAAALVGHCAQLARGMSSVASKAAAAANGDAAAALGVTALPPDDGLPAPEAAAGDERRLCLSYNLLVQQLMKVLCGSALPDAIAAARPFLPGLLQGLAQAQGGGSSALLLARDASWLAPVAALLAPAACAVGEAAEEAGRGTNGSGSLPGAEASLSPAGPAAGKRGGRKKGGSRRHSAQKENENANAAAEQCAAGDAADGPRAERGAGDAQSAADPPAVKALLQAAALSKTKEALIGLAVQLAAAAWPAGSDAALAAGAVELAVRCGLTPHPVTAAGQLAAPQWGAGCVAAKAAAEQLLLLRHRVLAAERPAEATGGGQAEHEGGGASGGAAAVPSGAPGAGHLQLLKARLEQLLPRERPRVTFAPLPCDDDE